MIDEALYKLDQNRQVKHIDAGVLNVAYPEQGSPNGWPVLLLHGFPYDIHSFDGVAPRLVEAGARTITPYARPWPDAVSLGWHAALGPTGGDWL